MENKGEIVVYQPNDITRLEVRIEHDSVWLTQAQIAELFQRDRTVVTRHIKNVFGEQELEEKSKSDEHSFELGAGWKDVLNDRFSAPSKEQLENWKYPSWYQKHLDEQEEYESQRDYIRQPVLKILEESKNGKTYNKDELTHIYAETLAKELDFICHHNDIAFEERINPATGEKMKFSTDEYGYARIKHEIPEICDFYGTDLVKSIIYISPTFH